VCFHPEHHDEGTPKMVRTFPSPKLPLNTLQMAYQTIIKMVGLIKDLKIQIHGIPYIAMLLVMENNVRDSNYSLLLGPPWLCSARVTHD
jgi:hypothetical protein